MTEDKNIYLQVGNIYGIEDYDDLKIPKYDRKTIDVKSRKFKDKVILAVYNESDFVKSDLKIIKGHTTQTTEYNGKKIEYYGFTHEHFFETLRNRKLSMLKEKDIEDDGTIFGEVFKTIIIPEKIIPEHTGVLNVKWNDWDDNYISDESL